MTTTEIPAPTTPFRSITEGADAIDEAIAAFEAAREVVGGCRYHRAARPAQIIDAADAVDEALRAWQNALVGDE